MGRKRKAKQDPVATEEQALREVRVSDRVVPGSGPGRLAERQAREDALIRSAGWVRPEDLETAADRVLMQGQEQMLQEIAALREMYETLKMPSNDPGYLQKLQSAERQRADLAKRILNVHIVPDGDKTWLSVGLQDPRNKAEAHAVARDLGTHLEARVISHEQEEVKP